MAGFKEYQMLFQLNASVGGSFQSSFSTGAASVTQLQQKINALNATQGDISSYQKQQTAIDKTKAKIDLYQTQLQNLQSATASTSKEEAELANAIAAKQKQLDDSTAKLDQQNAALSETGQRLREAGVDTSNLAGESERLKAEAAGVAQAQKEEAEAAQQAGESLRDAAEGVQAALEAAGVISALKSIYNGLEECSAAAREFETSMAGVKRTVGGSDGFIADLGESFKEMSTEMPITANELASIATTAGQLGIAQDNVERFTTVMAQLATTTDLTADNAATMLAQFANITGTTDYERLGATVAALGDSTATTASKVVEMSQGMAAAANIAGMSERDILAIAASVGSLGIEAASGSTSMSTLITTLYKATETGDKLEQFASVAGMTAEEFKQAWADDAVGALNAFIQGLNNVEQNGASAVVILDELGIKNVRQTKAILGLASAGDLLSNSVALANSAWSENTALVDKASIMYNTTEAKMTMMQNAANNVKVAIGDALNPALSSAADAATSLLQPFAEWLEKNPAIVTAVTAFVSVLGLATAGIATYTAVTKLAAAATKLFSLSLPGIGIVLGIATAVALLAAGLTSLGGEAHTAAEEFEALDKTYDDLITEAKHQKEVLLLVDSYKDLNTEMKNIQDLMADGFSTEVSFTAKGPDDNAKLTQDDFVDDNKVVLDGKTGETLAANSFLIGGKAVVNLTPKQAVYLATSDFIKDKTLTVWLTPAQASKLASQEFLQSSKVQLTPEQKDYLKSDDFIEGSKVIELTGEQVQKLEAVGFMSGTKVELTGEVLERVAAQGFLEEGTVVQLTASAYKDLKGSQFVADPTVTISAKADPETKLSAADFGISDQTLTYIATMKPESYAAVKEQAASIKQEIIKTDQKIGAAQTKIASAQESAYALQTVIDGTSDKDTKTALQQKLEDLNTTISEQETNLAELQRHHDSLSNQYSVVGTAAEELAGKEEALRAVQEALGLATDGTKGSMEEQTEAIRQQAEAEEALLKAQQALIVLRASESMKENAKQYASAAYDYDLASAEVEAATNRMDNLDGPQDLGTQLTSIVETMGDLMSYDNETPLDWDSAEIKEYRREVEALMSEATGVNKSYGNYDQMKRDVQSIVGSETAGLVATVNLGNEIETSTAKAAEAKAKMDAFVESTASLIESGAMEAGDVRKILTEAMTESGQSLENVDRIMEQVDATLEEHKQALSEAADAEEELADAQEETGESADTAVASAESIVQSLKDLKQAYEDAYDAAYSSMGGQFDLFEEAQSKIDKAAKGAEGGIAKMQQSLTEQAQYVKQYSANYQTAANNMEDAGISQETINAILGQLSDGSVESAQYLQTLATASGSELTELASAYNGLETSKAQYASTVAEIETNFSEKMASIESELANTVAEMDMSTEAAENAKSTLDAFVNAADSYTGLASTKYGAVAQAAVNALKKAFSGWFGYASGTENAQRGVAWVGEEGPELMWFNGGEKVMDHNSSMNYAKANMNAQNAEPIVADSTKTTGGGSQYSVDFNPVFNVESGVNADELKSVLESSTTSLKEQIQDILDEITEDENRRTLR